MSFLREGFAARAKDVAELMRSEQATFVLVSSADSIGLRAARSVAAEVVSREFKLGHVVFNRAFIAEAARSGDEPREYPPRFASLAPKLRRMRSALAEEQERKRVNVEAFCRDYSVRAWTLPEATRALGNPSALASWMEEGRMEPAVA
jgi:hypothetical protein